MVAIRYRSIEILKICPEPGSLLVDLTSIAPDHLNVFGIRSFEGRIHTVLSRRQPLNASLVQTMRSPPRGEFDLWDVGADLVIREQLPHPLNLLNVKPYDPGEGFALVPVKTTEQDLVAARRIASSTIFASGKAAFLVINETEPCSHRLDELALLGSVLPMRVNYREWTAHSGPIAASAQSVTEAQAIWCWLRSVVDLH